MSQYTITRSQWREQPRDYKTGDPRKGTAMMMVNGRAILTPVRVIPDKDACPKEREMWCASHCSFIPPGQAVCVTMGAE